MITEQEFASFLALEHELPGVEFKRAGPLSDRQLQAKVVRAALSMANKRDGGVVILGVDDDNRTLNPTGLSKGDLITWNHDDLADAVARYADPFLSFEEAVMRRGDLSFLVLSIQEFEEIPVLCKKDFPGVLRAGACYVRSRRKPETSEIPTQTEMRELLELATEKRLRRYIELSQISGSVSGSSDRYDQEWQRSLS